MSKFLHLLSIGFTFFSLAHANRACAEVLWDNWYIVTDHGKPDSYYNEKAELNGERAKIQVNTWIKVGTKIKSENLGATAKNTTLLEPLLYNFRTQNEGGIEKVIDGSIINNGKVFSVKIKEGTTTSKPLRAEMLPKLILSSFFPLWVNKNYKRINGAQPIEFHAIVEDQVQDQVPVMEGTAYEMNADAFSKKTETRKIRITFNRIVAIWYIAKKGDAVQIDIQSLEKTVKKVDRATAEKFLQ
jgi:predicted RNA-binding protein with TRAM domain